MADKTTEDLDPAGPLSGTELVHVVQGGNSRRTTTQAIANLAVQAGGPISGYFTQPLVIQSGSLRNDGTLALPSAPTEGNIMLYVGGGYGIGGSYVPAGFSFIQTVASNGNNMVGAWIRIVQPGDTGSYSVSQGDNQFCAIYELADCSSVVLTSFGTDIRGTAISPAFKTAVPTQNVGASDIGFFVMTQDQEYYVTSTPKEGWTETIAVTNGGNHTGLIGYYTSALDGFVEGTIGATVAPIWAVFHAIGVFVAGGDGGE